jgi:hypothetical protein
LHAAHQTKLRSGKSGCPRLRRRARKATRQHGLGALEQIFGDDRLEVAALIADAVLRHVDDAGVQLIAQQHADRLRAERLPTPVA